MFWMSRFVGILWYESERLMQNGKQCRPLIRLLLQEQSDQGSALFTQARLCQYWRSLWKIIWYECDTNDCVGLRSDTVSQNSNRKQFHLDNIICMEYHCICDFYLLHGFVWEIPYQTFTGIFYPPPPPHKIWRSLRGHTGLGLSVSVCPLHIAHGQQRLEIGSWNLIHEMCIKTKRAHICFLFRWTSHCRVMPRFRHCWPMEPCQQNNRRTAWARIMIFGS